MGSQTSVMVANAFPTDIWVKISRKPNKDSYWEGVLSDARDLEVHHGFERIITQEVSKLSKLPEKCKETDTVYITIVNHNSKGERKTVAKESPHSVKNTSVIVTTNGEVSAKCSNLWSDPWIDEAGKNHKCDPCEDCKVVSSVCTLCLVESKMGLIQRSIGVVQGCRVAETLISTMEQMSKQKVAKKEEEAAEMMKDIEELAKHYWTLEAKTKRSVRDVSAYGTNLKEAAEDFVEDGEIKDFWSEMLDMREVKQSLEAANEEHEIIKGKVKFIEKKAKGNAETFKKKVDKAKQYLDDLDADHSKEAATYLSIPVFGTVGGAIFGATQGALTAIEGLEDTPFDNLPSKVIFGSFAGVGGLVAGVGSSIVTLPAGPYLWYKAISSHFDAKNFGVLQEQFCSIAIQMGKIETHLGQITKALGDIETHLKYASKAEEKVMSVEGEKRKKMAERVIVRANELITACDAYFNLTKQNVTDNSKNAII